ncbi:unnamed protein product, partial [Rotaria magnacalcarata]
ENAIIEEAFSTLKKTHVIIDDYHIDFEHRVQIANDDKTKQRPIKRVEMNKEEGGRLREARFMPNPIVPSSSFHGLVGLRKIFIDSFMKSIDLKSVNDWEKRKYEIVEKAKLGILHEGQLVGKQCEANWIVEQLEKVKDKTKKDIGECCVYIYTLESFLYKILNHAMRLIGDIDHENSWQSAQLTDEMIAAYQHVARSKDPRRSFQAFTSCSRNRAKAEQFGNALFVLNAENRISYRTLNMDISALSTYPDEEEILIRPGRSFKIERVEFDKTKNKHIIYLTSISTSDAN